MDEWANPLTASALWTSRDGTFDRDAHSSFLPTKGAPPTPGLADALIRWDPWVRVNLGVTELLDQLDYELTAAQTYLVRRRGGANLVELGRPDLPFFVAQLSLVQSWAELRDERAAEILTQIDNQFAFIAAVTGLSVQRKHWTMEWLTIAIQFTIAVELKFKHVFACYRPVHLSPQVQPIITTPGHSAYPMGHAAQAFATVVALAGLLDIASTDEAYKQLYRQARRISVNRVVAGVHFPIDAPAGQAIGLSLGEYFLAACGIGTEANGRSFTPSGAGDATDNDFLGDGPLDLQAFATGTPCPAVTSPYLQKMTTLAREEWGIQP